MKAFATRIHQALRAWHTQTVDHALDDLLLARQLQTGSTRAVARLITNQILLSSIERLRQIDEKAGNLLHWRFLDQETAQAVSYRLNWSEDIVFQRQRAAIAQLTDIVWNQEQELRQQQRQRIEARLEPPSYSRLFGIADQVADVRLRLETSEAPWIVAVEGLGGSGKTSLVDSLVRGLAEGAHFHEIVWVSARRKLFQLSGVIDTLPARPDLTLAELIDHCLEQLGLAGLKHRSDDEKKAGLKDFFKAHPCLVVVDNLEAVADCKTLVSQLVALVNPSKVLITTRHSLRDLSDVSVLTLKPLSRSDTIALVCHEAATRGLPELVDASKKELAPIYDVTGGNPLAIKLIVGQVHSLSLPVALARFSTATGTPVETLLTYLYELTWQTLDSTSRQVLRAMLLVAEAGGRVQQIVATCGLDESTVISCLHRLAVQSLVNVGGTLHERRYSLHPLTHLFVAGQPIDETMQ
jgi:hypothetical protein